MPLGTLLLLSSARYWRKSGKPPAYTYHDKAISRALSATRKGRRMKVEV
jgi:hypothetical protein